MFLVAFWRRLIPNVINQQILDEICREKQLSTISLLPEVYPNVEALENYIVLEHMLPLDYETTAFAAIVNENDIYVWGLEEMAPDAILTPDHMTWDITRRFPIVDSRPVYQWDYYLYEEDGEE